MEINSILFYSILFYSILFYSILFFEYRIRSRGYETFFSCSAQLRLKFIMLINVKMPTVVGILTFISRINYCLMGYLPEFSTDFGYFSFYELLKFHAQLS